MSRARSSRHRAAHGSAAAGAPVRRPVPLRLATALLPRRCPRASVWSSTRAPSNSMRTPFSAARPPACCGCPGTGRAALAELRAGPVRSDAAGRLARKLTDTGLAHPRPPELACEARCHGPHPGPGPRCPARPLPVRPGGQLSGAGGGRRLRGSGRGRGRRRRARRGAGAAAGQRRPRCRPEHRPAQCGYRPGGVPGQRLRARAGLDRAARRAPGRSGRGRRCPADGGRAAGPGWAGRYTTAACCLDLGDAEARVVPGTRVAYVPTAALVVRRAALAPGRRGWQRLRPGAALG